MYFPRICVDRTWWCLPSSLIFGRYSVYRQLVIPQNLVLDFWSCIRPTLVDLKIRLTFKGEDAHKLRSRFVKRIGWVRAQRYANASKIESPLQGRYRQLCWACTIPCGGASVVWMAWGALQTGCYPASVHIYHMIDKRTVSHQGGLLPPTPRWSLQRSVRHLLGMVSLTLLGRYCCHWWWSGSLNRISGQITTLYSSRVSSHCSPTSNLSRPQFTDLASYVMMDYCHRIVTLIVGKSCLLRRSGSDRRASSQQRHRRDVIHHQSTGYTVTTIVRTGGYLSLPTGPRVSRIDLPTRLQLWSHKRPLYSKRGWSPLRLGRFVGSLERFLRRRAMTDDGEL